jgi:glycosyltransferase involved in cell wall biosynthesis
MGEKWYRDAGINVLIRPLSNNGNVLKGLHSAADYDACLGKVQEVLEEQQPDVVIANCLNSFFVVDAARRAGIPSVWIIHESYSQEKMLQELGGFAMPLCERAFSDAYRVVFVSTDTMRLYERYAAGHNAALVHNGLDARRIDAFTRGVEKSDAARQIDAPPGKKLVTTVGTICTRKDQLTLARAVAILARERDDFCCYMVGLRDEETHSREVRRFVEENRLQDLVRLIPEIDADHVLPHLRAADVFVFTSHLEAYSRTILEAEAFGLPIITTFCEGIAEQVRGEVNALLFEKSDAVGLARHIAALLDDRDRREELGNNSRKVFEFLWNYDDMIDRYEQLVVGGWVRGPMVN